jgi:hypothetical protein
VPGPQGPLGLPCPLPGEVRLWPRGAAAKSPVVWEHLFVTSQGSAYGRFRRALDTGNANLALAAAADLEHVELADAFELLLLMLESEPSRFERAALRWHGRYCREVSDVDLAEAQAVLACLAGLRGSRPEPAAHALADLVHRRDLARASEVLNRWGATRAARSGRI